MQSPLVAAWVRHGGAIAVARRTVEVQSGRLGMSKQHIAPPDERWTRVEAYVESLARLRIARRSRAPKQRTEPEAPNLMLSTVPFATLIGVMGMLIVVFAIAAWPPSQPRFEPPKSAEHEAGKAAPGWFDEAKKNMR